MHTWWLIALKHPKCTQDCRTMMKLVMGTTQLKSCISRYNKSNDVLFNDCDDYVKESTEHVLFECSGNIHLRSRLCQLVLDQFPQQLRQELYRMSSKSKVLFLIFAAMKCNYNNDWGAIYVAMLNFVERVYKRMLNCQYT